MTRLTTESGSVYELDERHHKWARVDVGKTSGLLRTTDGVYRSAMYELGKPLIIVADPITEGAIFRLIETTPIINVEITDETKSQEVHT